MAPLGEVKLLVTGTELVVGTEWLERVTSGADEALEVLTDGG
jgi:hypothetical protein